MSGRIRTGFYVLGLIRIRNCGTVGEMARSFLLFGRSGRRPGWPRHASLRAVPGQSPSCFRSRR